MKTAECHFCKKPKKCRRLKGVPFRAMACPECSLNFYLRRRLDDYRFAGQTGSVSMGAIIFMVLGFVLFVGATFMFVRQESTVAVEAKKIAAETDKRVDALEKKIFELQGQVRGGDDAIRSLLDTILKSDEKVRTNLDGIDKKLQWVDVKLQSMKSQPAPSNPQKLVLTQEKPLAFQVVYRPMQKKKPLTEEQAKKKVIENMKRKVNELSQ